MYIVAITRLGTTIEQEAAALARDLGTLAYEQRLKLAVGTPAVVLSTPDAAKASAVIASVRARGHEAMQCRDDDMARLFELRHPQLEPDALVAAGPTPARLRWSDIAVLVRACQRRTIEKQVDVAEERFNAARAVVSGGLLTHKTVHRTAVNKHDEVEQVLYLFARTGDPPWMLREQRAFYDALGPAMTPSSNRNFGLLVERLRIDARSATFDARLMPRRGPPAEIDILAYLLASAARGEPFR